MTGYIDRTRLLTSGPYRQERTRYHMPTRILRLAVISFLAVSMTFLGATAALASPTAASDSPAAAHAALAVPADSGSAPTATPKGIPGGEPPECDPNRDGEFWYDTYYEQWFQCVYVNDHWAWILYLNCPKVVRVPGVTSREATAVPACAL